MMNMYASFLIYHFHVIAVLRTYQVYSCVLEFILSEGQRCNPIYCFNGVMREPNENMKEVI